MNEQAVQTVISEYAIENANLRLAVATLKAENDQLKTQLEVEKAEEEKEVKK